MPYTIEQIQKATDHITQYMLFNGKLKQNQLDWVKQDLTNCIKHVAYHTPPNIRLYCDSPHLETLTKYFIKHEIYFPEELVVTLYRDGRVLDESREEHVEIFGIEQGFQINANLNEVSAERPLFLPQYASIKKMNHSVDTNPSINDCDSKYFMFTMDDI